MGPPFMPTNPPILTPYVKDLIFERSTVTSPIAFEAVTVPLLLYPTSPPTEVSLPKLKVTFTAAVEVELAMVPN